MKLKTIAGVLAAAGTIVAGGVQAHGKRLGEG